MYDPDIHIPVSLVLLELLMLYEDTGTQQRFNPVLSTLTDQLLSEENVSRYRLPVLHCSACYGGHPEVVVQNFLTFFMLLLLMAL